MKTTENMATIHMAIQTQQDDVVEMLLPLDRQDICVNMVDWNGNSCLMLACKYDPHLARTLLKDAQVDVNIRNQQGRTALHIAIGEGNPPLVKRLMKRYDIDMKIRDKMGQTPYSLAQMKCYRRITKAIKEKLLDDMLRA